MNENNLVEILNDEVITTSKQVAEVFGKEHKNVIQNIKNLIENSTAENSALLKMFAEDSYTASNGKKNKMYIMNRDGFTLLAMGFTGSKAIEFKLKYIEAFNQMEQQLKEQMIDLSVPSYQINDPVKRALVWAEETRRSQLKLEEKQQTIEAQKPKVEYHDDVLNSDNLMTATQLAKSIGLKTAMELNEILRKLGVQYKQSGNWLLRSKYEGKGYAKLITTREGYKQLKWTETGRKFVYELLIKEGVI